MATRTKKTKSTPTKAILEELNRLHKLEGIHQLIVDGKTHYKIIGSPIFPRTFRAPRKETTIRPDHNKKNWYRIAVDMYGGQIGAMNTIKRQLDAMGDDLDPDVRKRAENLSASLAKPFFIQKNEKVNRERVGGRRGWVITPTGIIENYSCTGLAADLFAHALDRASDANARALFVTEEEIKILKQKYIIKII